MKNEKGAKNHLERWLGRKLNEYQEAKAIGMVVFSKNPVIKKLLACKDEKEFDKVYSSLTKKEVKIMQSEKHTLLAGIDNKIQKQGEASVRD
jgi:hypothetical protein